MFAIPSSIDNVDMASWLLFAALLFFAINVLTYAAFADDKARARAGRRRTAEASLLRLALFGGAVGALLAQAILRHKSRKQPFASLLRLIAILHAMLLIGLATGLLPLNG